MGEAIAITSGKGGVGKSSTVLNIAAMLAQMGQRVCMVDMDLGLKNLDVMMGLENRVFYDLKDVLDGRCPLSRAMLRDKHQEQLYLLPACKSIHIDRFDGEGLKLVIEQLKRSFDYVLLDTPAGIESGFRHSLSCVSKAILVTTLDVTSLQDCDRVIGILMREGIEQLSFIVNRMNVRFIEKGVCVSLEEARQWLAIDFLGYVFDDEEIIRANNRGASAILQRTTAVYSCYHALAKRLLGEPAVLPKYKEKSFLQKLFG